MHFKLKLDKDNLAMVGSGDKKGKSSDDAGLKKKFGDQAYDKVKEAFEESLKSWKDDKDEVNKQGFHFYEEFRPEIIKGQKGWGRQGELNLSKIKSVVGR